MKLQAPGRAFAGGTAALLLLFPWGAEPAAQAQTPPAVSGAGQDGGESTNRLVFKKRPRRAYNSTANIQALEAEQQVPQEKEDKAGTDAAELAAGRPTGRRDDAFDLTSIHEAPRAEVRRERKEKKTDENWLLVPGSPLDEVLSSLRAGGDEETENKDGWGWLADEVIARNPHSVLGAKRDKKTADAKKKERDAEEQEDEEDALPVSSIDRAQERQLGMFTSPREDAGRRAEKDKGKDARDRTPGSKSDGTGEGDAKTGDRVFDRTLLTKDHEPEGRDRNMATYDDPNRTMRAHAAEPGPAAKAEEPAYPMIQSLLSDLRSKVKPETPLAIKTESVAKPAAQVREDPASSTWSALGTKPDGGSATPLGRPVLGNMDTSGKIGGLFGPAQTYPDYESRRTIPGLPSATLPAPMPSTRSYAAPQWPSAVNRGSTLWSPAAPAMPSASRLPGLGADRTLPAIPNNATLPGGTPYTRSGSGLSTGFPK